MYSRKAMWKFSLTASAGLLALSMPLRSHAQFIPNCTDAAPGAAVKDPEFDQVGYYAAWQVNPVITNNRVTSQGTVKLANIDHATGNFDLSSVQNVASSNPYPTTITHNGPEWGRDQSGAHVFYTSYSSSSYSNIKVGRIDLSPVSALWSMSAVNYPAGNGFPFASLDGTFESAFLTFFKVTIGANVHKPKVTGNAFSNSSNPDQIVGVSPEIQHGGRFVSQPAGPVILYTANQTVGGAVLNRPAFHDVNSGTYFNQLISDTKNRISYYAFRAPELLPGAEQQLDDVVVVGTTPRGDATGGVDLEVFKMDRLTRNLVLWTRFVSSSKKYVKITSPEAFIFNGRSYLSLEVRSKSEAEGIVLIASVDPSLTGSAKVLRIVSPVTTGVMRRDPESLMIRPSATSRKMIVYYNETIGSALRIIKCDTGLVSDQAAG